MTVRYCGMHTRPHTNQSHPANGPAHLCSHWVLFHPGQGGSAASRSIAHRANRRWDEGRGRDCRRTAAAQRRDVTEPDTRARAPARTRARKKAHARISDVRQRKVEKGKRGHTLHTDKRQAHSHFCVLMLLQGEFNRALISNASDLYSLVELLVCFLCAVSYSVASRCGHKNAAKGRARRSQ